MNEIERVKQEALLGDEELEEVYEKAYKKLCDYSEKYPMGLSSKNFNPNRPADI